MSFSQIGRGIYSLAEAERLVRVPRGRIRRWTRGYTYRVNHVEHYSPPIIGITFEDLPAISFADLIEVRFLDAFRRHGVKWNAIRVAAERAKEFLGRHHPFSTKIFKTDGRTILAEIVGPNGDKHLLDLVRNEYAFERVISPYLYEGLDFDDISEAERWWPLGWARSVVIDPRRAFGAPIVVKGGVPTKILSDALATEGSIEFVADWYQVDPQEVKDAADFEARIAA